MVARISLKHDQFALVDDEDAERVLAFRWCLSAGDKGYAIRRRKKGEPDTWGGIHIRMHHFIIGKHPGLHVDHIDGNPLNNCRANLRVCTLTQNLRNQKPQAGRTFKGAYFVSGRWCARIRVNGRLNYIGWFDNEIDAARAWDRAAIRHHGEFARLNLPHEARA